LLYAQFDLFCRPMLANGSVEYFCVRYLMFSKSNLNDDCGIIDYGVQLQLRTCLSETSSEQADAFPPNFSLCVNGTPRSLQVIE